MASTLAAARHHILARFPTPFSFCFAYGSGVKQQLGYSDVTKARPNSGSKSPSATMIDLILCVDDAFNWHTENMRLNPGDYSSLARLAGVKNVTRMQLQFGARVYCNTLIPLPSGVFIKYGVISTHHLLDDLLNWTHLYVAGRLHKPVEILRQPANDQIEDALVTNRQSAVHMALLRQPETFSPFELFYTIANLSYSGDFRMRFGEKKDKVRNIVTPQLNEFYTSYLPVLEKLSDEGFLVLPSDVTGRITQDVSPDAVRRNLQRLPCTVRGLMARTEEGLDEWATRPGMRQRLSGSLESIVSSSSIGQSLKNIPTAGLGKAVRYSWQKVLKTFNM